MEYISRKVAICSLWTVCPCFLQIGMKKKYLDLNIGKLTKIYGFFHILKLHVEKLIGLPTYL